LLAAESCTFCAGILKPEEVAPEAQRILERFHNSHALSGIFKGGFFLMKKPLGSCGPGVRQL